MADPADLLIRCPRLGDEVSLAYCEREGGDLPCRLIFRCWQAVLPLEARLRERLGETRWSQFLDQVQAPRDRLASLLELAAEARARRKGETEGSEG